MPDALLGIWHTEGANPKLQVAGMCNQMFHIEGLFKFYKKIIPKKYKISKKYLILQNILSQRTTFFMTI